MVILSTSDSAFDLARFLPCPIQSKATSARLPASQCDLFFSGWSVSARENDVDVHVCVVRFVSVVKIPGLFAIIPH